MKAIKDEFSHKQIAVLSAFNHNYNLQRIIGRPNYKILNKEGKIESIFYHFDQKDFDKEFLICIQLLENAETYGVEINGQFYVTYEREADQLIADFLKEGMEMTNNEFEIKCEVLTKRFISRLKMQIKEEFDSTRGK